MIFCYSIRMDDKAFQLMRDEFKNIRKELIIINKKVDNLNKWESKVKGISAGFSFLVSLVVSTISYWGHKIFH